MLRRILALAPLKWCPTGIGKWRSTRVIYVGVLAAMALVFAAHPTAQLAPAAATRGGAVPLPIFPADNWWNQDISTAPVDPASAQFIGFIGAERELHPDFGGLDLERAGFIYGMPYAVVDGSQPKQTVQFEYASESDGVTHPGNVSFPFYPIPEAAKTESFWIEGGPPGNTDPGGDRHMLILDRDNRHLYELFALRWTGTQWEAGSGAFFDLNRNDRRPDRWTSADAAGLAIFPGLIRYDEVVAPDEIRHAFRVTVRASNGYVWPASHRAGNTAGALPMGARLRLKASVNLSGYRPEVQRIFRAMQRYGLIVADNGSDMYITGTHDTRWNNGVLNPAFESLQASDFEVVQLGWRGPSGPCTSPGAPVGFAADVSGYRVTLRWAPPTSGGVESYAIEAGTQTGVANIGTFALPASQTTFVVDAPGGRYYVRVRARNACGGTATSDALVVVPAGCSTLGAPGQPSANVVGTTVALNWSGVASATSYLFEVGSVAGASDVLRIPVAGTGINGAAPRGLYHVRVRAQNACGPGLASPERLVSIGGCSAPAPQGSLTSTIANGNVVTLEWPPMAGALAYRLEVGSGPGASNILVTTLGTNRVTTAAPPGNYHVRVRGLSDCAAGDATNEVVVTIQN